MSEIHYRSSLVKNRKKVHHSGCFANFMLLTKKLKFETLGSTEGDQNASWANLSSHSNWDFPIPIPIGISAGVGHNPDNPEFVTHKLTSGGKFGATQKFSRVPVFPPASTTQNFMLTSTFCLM